MTSFALRYDLRAPDFGAAARHLYAAALDQCAWADARGFSSVTLSEHHGTDDGYLPAPIVFGAAIAGRTSRMTVRIAASIAPLHDPIHLAEQLAVLDLASGGRLEVVLVAGMRPTEFAMFGREASRRGELLEDAVRVLREAWTGEPFEHRGHRVRVTPTPLQDPGPPLLLGGSGGWAARCAARVADGFLPAVPELYEAYVEACHALGRDPGRRPVAVGPFIHVTRDPEAAWARIAPHALHESNSYGRWYAEAATLGPYAAVTDPEELRRSRQYLVLTPEECVEYARELGPEGVVTLHPLMGGLSPELGWESLELVAEAVVPALG